MLPLKNTPHLDGMWLYDLSVDTDTLNLRNVHLQATIQFKSPSTADVTCLKGLIIPVWHQVCSAGETLPCGNVDRQLEMIERQVGSQGAEGGEGQVE